MKLAQLFSVPASNGFAWKWRAADTRAESPGTFVYYHDCVQDAVKHGYTVEGGTEVLWGGPGENPPTRGWLFSAEIEHILKVPSIGVRYPPRNRYPALPGLREFQTAPPLPTTAADLQPNDGTPVTDLPNFLPGFKPTPPLSP